MNLDDLQKITALSQESTSIQQALTMFSENKRITAITVGAVPPYFSGVTVPTAYVDYPQMMIDEICVALEARQQEITQELDQMGVAV